MPQAVNDVLRWCKIILNFRETEMETAGIDPQDSWARGNSIDQSGPA